MCDLSSSRNCQVAWSPGGQAPGGSCQDQCRPKGLPYHKWTRFSNASRTLLVPLRFGNAAPEATGQLTISHALPQRFSCQHASQLGLQTQQEPAIPQHATTVTSHHTHSPNTEVGVASGNSLKRAITKHVVPNEGHFCGGRKQVRPVLHGTAHYLPGLPFALCPTSIASYMYVHHDNQ